MITCTIHHWIDDLVGPVNHFGIFMQRTNVMYSFVVDINRARTGKKLTIAVGHTEVHRQGK